MLAFGFIQFGSQFQSFFARESAHIFVRVPVFHLALLGAIQHPLTPAAPPKFVDFRLDLLASFTVL